MTTNVPRVSVVIPAYNAENTLSESIDSILAQTYTDFELIIIDDCSTDKTWSIIHAYAQKDARIVPVKNKINVGIGLNRAKGVELSKGEYVCWQDADDISLPRRIAAQVEYLEKHKDVGVVGCGLELFNGDKTIGFRRYEEHDAELRKTIFKYNPLAQPASMFRKECFEKVGNYKDYKVSEDLEMFFRVGTRYKFANVQETLLRYRQAATSLTGKSLRKMERATLSLRRQYAKHEAYKMSFSDYAFNISQRIALYVIPAGIKIKLFNLIRNKSK